MNQEVSTVRHRLALWFLVLPVLFVLLAPKRAQGQVLISLLLGDKVSSEKFHLGINVGLNLADLFGMDGTKMRTGFNLGILGEWRFAKNWYLQPELGVFYYAGANKLPAGIFPPPPELEDSLDGDDVQRRLKYFTIPLIVKYGVADNRLHLGLGPQVGFLTSATDTYKGTASTGNKITADEDIKGSSASTDAGILLNVEWKIRPGFSPSLVARYYLGLVDTIKDNPGDAVYNRVLSVLLTIPIGGDPSKKKPDSED
jgi:hypothetical protein